MGDAPELTGKRHPWVSTLATPLLLLAAIGAWAWLAHAPRPDSNQTTPSATAVAVAGVATAAPTRGLAGLATPWAVAGAAVAEVAPTPAPSPAAPEPIALLGPPSGSLFRGDDDVSFYWNWPGALDAEQRFVLFVAVNGQAVAVGEVDEANLGEVYRFQASASAALGTSGQYQWWVVLQDEATGVIVGQSETRPIGVAGG